MLWLSISTAWLDFLPGAGSKSTGRRISSQFRFSSSYGVHVLTGGRQMLAAQNFPRHAAKTGSSATVIRLGENCLEQKLRHRFYAFFELQRSRRHNVIKFLTCQLDAGGKPSTWFPPGMTRRAPRAYQLSIYFNLFYIIDPYRASISTNSLQKSI